MRSSVQNDKMVAYLETLGFRSVLYKMCVRRQYQVSNPGTDSRLPQRRSVVVEQLLVERSDPEMQ